MKTQAVVVADDPVYLSWLENAAGSNAEFSLIRPLDAEDLIERVQMMGRIDVVFFQFERVNLDARLVMMERLVERAPDIAVRSEEHTSDLQSLMRTSYAVFCLKKKTK